MTASFKSEINHNGVILVTTKGGKDGRVSVKYNMYYQMKENPKLLETMDPYDYV